MTRKDLFAGAISLAIAFAASCGGAQAYTYRKIYDFCSRFDCSDGSMPASPPIVDSAGNLFGTTLAGGGGAFDGTVYELTRAVHRRNWKYLKLHTFCSHSGCSDGSSPYASLIIDVHGNLYGTAFTGGNGCGTVFEVQRAPGGGRPSFAVLYAFPNSGQGCGPQAALSYAGKSSGLPYDGTSPLYGTTAGGAGLVYMLTPGAPSWTFTDLFDFCEGSRCKAGEGPIAEVYMDGSGNLFGTTNGGGKYNNGVAFELMAGAPPLTEKILHYFCSRADCRDGAFGTSPLLPDATGALFGMTSSGGTSPEGCCGVLYKLAQDGGGAWRHQVVYDFCSLRNCDDGAAPRGALVMDSSGTLFGATVLGGGHNGVEGIEGGGTIFSLSGTALTTLHAFCSAGTDCTDGAGPQGVVLDAAGNLFGTGIGGGLYGKGVVFELVGP